jgi:peptide/nickel transport system ATP-binding protein
MLFISHDLSVVRYIADRVVVMYLGYIVEQGTTDQIFSPPYHPYTEALLSAIPIADTSVVKKHIVLEGDIPSAMNPPSGCPFQTRCRYKHLVPDNLCETKLPPVKELGDGHKSLCWLSDDVLAKMEPVISFTGGGDKAPVHDMVPEDAPRASGPGFAGVPPKRPRGKTASAAAAAAGGSAEEAEAAGRLRREDGREDRSETGGTDRREREGPDTPVGWGSQADDPDAPSPFRKTVDELAEDEDERKDKPRK